MDAKAVSPPRPSLQMLSIHALAGRFFPTDHPRFYEVLNYKGNPITYYEHLTRDTLIMIVLEDGIALAYFDNIQLVRSTLGLETQNLQHYNPQQATSRARFHQFVYGYLMVAYKFTSELTPREDHSMQTREMFNIYAIKNI